MKDLAQALAQFQAQRHSASRDSKGNYGTYTSLAAALAAAQAGTAFGLSHTQTMKPVGGDEPAHVLITTLLHTSGDQLTSEILLPSKAEGRGNYMQALGSALTYARRYAILAIYGLASEDDDGQIAAQPPVSPAKREATKAVIIVTPPQSTQDKVPSATDALVVFLDADRKDRLCAELKASPAKEAILDSFKVAFNIQAERMGPSQIQLPAHADFLEAQLASSY